MGPIEPIEHERARGRLRDPDRPGPEGREEVDDLTLEAPGVPAALAPDRAAPGWGPPVLAAAAWGGAALAAGVGVVQAAVAGALVGAGVARAACRWPAGGLLALAGWTIGGIGVGAVIEPTAAPAACAFWDAGLAAVGVVALASDVPEESVDAWWVWPARALAVVGFAQVGARLGWW